MPWVDIPDAQTPEWAELLPHFLTAFQADAFQYDLLAFQIRLPPEWALVDDSETPNWALISGAGNSNWTIIDDSETPNWTPVTT